MDTSALGVLTARAMDAIAETYGDDAVLRTAALVLEVDLEDGTDILVTATDSRAWVQVAFLKEGVWTLEREMDKAATEED